MKATFKVTVELIEPEKVIDRMDISDAGLAKSKQESLNKVKLWCEDEIWGWKIAKLMFMSRELGMLPYTNY